MKIICPIRPQNFKDYLYLLQKINNRVDIVEIWLDELESPSLFFEKFKKLNSNNEKKVKLLAVCKRANEKGAFMGNTSERVNLLQKFLKASGDIVDLDITKNKITEIQTISPKNLILSFHDFEKTPENLKDIFKKMQKFEPLVYKFAVTTNTKKELKVFLDFIQSFPKEKNAIFTTMGIFGKAGRKEIGNQSWGQFFALDKKSTTASGQQTLDDLVS